MDYDKHDYYSKYDYYIMVFGCVCLLTFLACVFLNHKDNNLKCNNANTTVAQVTDKKTLKEDLDDLSKRIDIIREKLLKAEAKEKGLK